MCITASECRWANPGTLTESTESPRSAILPVGRLNWYQYITGSRSSVAYRREFVIDDWLFRTNEEVCKLCHILIYFYRMHSIESMFWSGWNHAWPTVAKVWPILISSCGIRVDLNIELLLSWITIACYGIVEITVSESSAFYWWFSFVQLNCQ